jgi:hypothetical protein
MVAADNLLFFTRFLFCRVSLALLGFFRCPGGFLLCRPGF